MTDSILLFLLVVFAGSVFGGVVGALAGLGGGIVVIPLLTIGLGVDIRYAIGASIVAVIATSSGAAAAYVRDRLTNLRVGMFLELATTTGAIVGASVGGLVSRSTLFIVFGVVLAISIVPQLARLREEFPAAMEEDAWSARLRLGAVYYDSKLKRNVPYVAARVPLGLAVMWVSGVISGLLGIGSGAFKVLAMDTAMRLPMKVSTTTSNFMIGVTAAASAGIYWNRGDVDPVIAGPVALGVLLGAMMGSWLLRRLRNVHLRRIFLLLVFLTSIQMILRGLGIGV